jgi:hypothetical protein
MHYFKFDFDDGFLTIVIKIKFEINNNCEIYDKFKLFWNKYIL